MTHQLVPIGERFPLPAAVVPRGIVIATYHAVVGGAKTQASGIYRIGVTTRFLTGGRTVAAR